MSGEAPNGNSKEVTPADKVAELTCGLIMPISSIDGCTADHWLEVKKIIIEAVDSISSPRFITRLVSDADEVGVIQKRIIQSVYNSSIVVCDVSAKNPNVMFELGLRLAFDKPTVIIKDDKTDYSFDTGVIEHISYPRDLRFSKVVEFKTRLAEKLTSTYKASVEDTNHSPFLKSFGQFHVASLEQSVTSPNAVMFEMLSDMQRDIQILKRRGYDVCPETAAAAMEWRTAIAKQFLLKGRVNYFTDHLTEEAVAKIFDKTREGGRMFAEPPSIPDDRP